MKCPVIFTTQIIGIAGQARNDVCCECAAKCEAYVFLRT